MDNHFVGVNNMVYSVDMKKNWLGFSLKAVHSARGTQVFKGLSARKQVRWARWDSRHSRGAIRRG